MPYEVPLRVDSHVHTWGPRGAAPDSPFAFPSGLEPPIDGEASHLIAEMDQAGVQRAFIVQPKNHVYDHSYFHQCVRDFPDRFHGILLADPGPHGIADMEKLVASGHVGVRFHPGQWPKGERFSNEAGKALFAKAGELGVPVQLLMMEGLLAFMEDIQILVSHSPQTKVVLDHFAFGSTDSPREGEWEALMKLATNPNISVKTSAFFRVAKDPYPYLR